MLVLVYYLLPCAPPPRLRGSPFTVSTCRISFSLPPFSTAFLPHHCLRWVTPPAASFHRSTLHFGSTADSAAHCPHLPRFAGAVPADFTVPFYLPALLFSFSTNYVLFSTIPYLLIFYGCTVSVLVPPHRYLPPPFRHLPATTCRRSHRLHWFCCYLHRLVLPFLDTLNTFSCTCCTYHLRYRSAGSTYLPDYCSTCCLHFLPPPPLPLPFLPFHYRNIPAFHLHHHRRSTGHCTTAARGFVCVRGPPPHCSTVTSFTGPLHLPTVCSTACLVPFRSTIPPTVLPFSLPLGLPFSPFGPTRLPFVAAFLGCRSFCRSTTTGLFYVFLVAAFCTARILHACYRSCRYYALPHTCRLRFSFCFCYWFAALRSALVPAYFLCTAPAAGLYAAATATVLPLRSPTCCGFGFHLHFVATVSLG